MRPRIKSQVRHEQHRPLVVKHVAQIVDSAVYGGRQTALLYQLLVFKAVVAFDQNLIDQAHRIIFRRVAFRHVIRNRNRRALRQRIHPAGLFFFFLLWLGQVRNRRKLRGLDSAEIFFHHLPCLRRIKITDNGQRRIIWRVVRFEERLNIGQCSGFDVLQITIKIVCVVPVHVGVLGHIEPRKSAIRPVDHVHLHFVADHALLILQIVFGDRQAIHAVRFGPQRGFQLVRWQNFKIVGEVKTGRAVQNSAVLLHQLDEFHLSEIL